MIYANKLVNFVSYKIERQNKLFRKKSLINGPDLGNICLAAAATETATAKKK